MDIVFLAGIVVTVATAVPVLWQLTRHPRGLFILFFAEMWERFSYYGMRGLLIFFMTQHFLFDDGVAARQYGAYTSLVYLLPLIGGFLADDSSARARRSRSAPSCWWRVTSRWASKARPRSRC